MKTRIRDSYTPKLGDYCNTLVVDKETGNQYLFDADGVWTLISTDEEGIIEEAVAQANAYTDDVAEGKVDKEEGKGLSENDFTDADKDKLDGIEAGAQENVIEVVKRNGTALPIVDKTVDVEVPTATSALTNDSGYITNTVDDLVNYYDKDETDTLIAAEAETRDAADLDLQEQIDAISSASDVVDVVGTYAELQNYDTSKLGNNDIIKVLTDETHDDAISYYRWDDTTETFTYIGSQGPFYTKSETDATFVPQTRTINGKGLNSDVVLTAADVNALPASTVIPTVNDATLTIKKNGTTVTTFTANSAQNATADISVPTKVSDLTNDLDFVEESDLAPVALSGAYADLAGKPSIPTKTSDLTNDSDFVSDANYVHTDNNFTTTLKNKLNGIATGAEVNVQSDWNVTDTSSDAFIKNKPSIPTKTSDLTNDSGFITSAAVPTKTSDLTNDSGFITKNVSDLTNYYTETEVNGMFNALSIPTKTSDLVNDSGFLTTLPIASTTTLGGVKIGSGINVAADGTISAAVASLDWANITNKPTNVSYWTNDAGYITSAALPTKTSDLTNDSGFITSAAVPTKTSDLTNDSGFITDATNNLANYYKKSETYTQGEVNSLLNAIVVPTKTSDLINDGADGTSTYVEADDLATVATSGSYTDLLDKPTIGNATLTIQKNGTDVQTFTANATSNKTANITVPTKTSDLTNDSDFVSNTDYATTTTGGVVKVGGGLEITNGVLSATGGGTADAVEWDNVLNKPSFSTVATSGSYNDLSDKPTIPTVNNATLTIQRNSTNVGTFTANASSNKTINITVPTTAADVSALPASTKYGASITVSLNTTDYKMTTTLKDQDGNTLGTAQTVDLPLESVVVNGSYDSTNKKIVLTLQNGNTVDIPVGDLIAGLQTEITSTNKLSSDLVDDTGQTHKFVTAAQITKLNGIAAGAEVNQNAFSNVKVGSTTVAADAKTDTLELVAGSNVTLTPDATNDKVTIAATDTTYSNATTSTAGLMSAADKTKLNGIATGAEVNIQSDWSVTDTSSDAFIKNKPTIPTVNNGQLTIQKNGANVATFTANQSGNVTANITVPTIDDVITITKTLAAPTDWTDTGISHDDLETGTYVVQVYTGAQYASLWSERWSGIMTWYAGGTNSGDADEILLHNAGHASNNRDLFLRVKRNSRDSGDLSLQYAFTNADETETTITFSFRRLI